MSENQICRRISEQIAGYRDGLLNYADRQELERHIAICPSCAEEVRMDERLCQTLSTLSCEQPPAVSWAQVYAAHNNHVANKLRTRPLLFSGAAISAAVFLALVALWPHGEVINRQQPGAPHVRVIPPIDNQTPHTTVFADANLVMDAADITGDPNRAIIFYAAQQEHGRAK